MMYRTKCQLFASVLTILLLSQDVIGLQCPGRYLYHGYATMCETESAAADPAEVQSCLTKAIADTTFTCNAGNDGCMEVNIQIDPGFFSDTDNRIWSFAACYNQTTPVLLCSEDRVGTTTVASSTQSGSSTATSTEVTSAETVTTSTEEPTTSAEAPTEAPTTSTAATSTATTSPTSGPSTTSTASTSTATTSTATTSTATTSTATTSTATTSTATTSTSTTTASTSTASTSTQSTTTGPSTSTSTVVTTTTTTDAPTTTTTTTEAPTTSQATTSDAPSVGASSTEAGSTTTDTVLPMFEGCIWVEAIDFGAAACANREVKAVGVVANANLTGILYPTVDITATLLGCCDAENCRVDDGVTRDKTCSFGSGTDVVDVECEGACYGYLKINGGTTTAMRGCLKDLDLTDSTFSNVDTCQHKDGTCTDTSSATECLRCCTDNKCNTWTTKDDLLGNSASSVSMSVLTLLVCSLLAIKLN